MKNVFYQCLQVFLLEYFEIISGPGMQHQKYIS